MISFVNAKINIGLYVTGRRADGYHDLSTVFYPIGKLSGSPESPWPFSDILEITPLDAESHEFSFTGTPIACPPEKNLVVKAVDAFEKAYTGHTGNKLPRFDIRLYKHIPDGAGLGGGSADASFTLKMLNGLTGNIFSDSEMIRLAASLGADCPFFIINRPCAAAGVGEILRPIDLDLSGKWLVILKPSFGISTKEAFSGIDCRHLSESRCPVSAETLILESWRDSILNDFEPHLFYNHPVLKSIKSSLYDSGAIYVQMSGSGSAVYGIFDDESAASKAYVNGKSSEGTYSAIMKL